MTANALIANETLAVIDALHRYAAGIDLRDRELLASSLAEDAISDFRPAAAKAGFDYPVLQGRETLVSALSASLTGIDTTHTVSNPRVWLNGETAQVEALVEAQHVLQDDPSRHYMMKNRYAVDLSRDGEVWVIRRIVVDNVWRNGDPSVLAGV